jgi:hypothetical protein
VGVEPEGAMTPARNFRGQVEAKPIRNAGELRRLSKYERCVIEKLDEDLDELGFPGQLEELLSDRNRDDPGYLLSIIKGDVWHHYGNVGDEESRPVYEEAERLIREAMHRLPECVEHEDCREHFEMSKDCAAEARRMRSVAKPNRARVRVFDAEDEARKMRETFVAKPVKERVKLGFHWPAEMQHVGDSLAVAYSSDKWKNEGDTELYKHLAESRNRVLCVPGFLRDADRPERELGTIGPIVSFSSTMMPRDIAILALFEEADIQLHTAGTDDRPAFRNKKDGVIKVTVAHGMLGGGKMKDGRVFLVVYTNKDGPLMLVFGDELNVEADGLTG